MFNTPFGNLGGGVSITAVDPEDFSSIDFRDKNPTPTSSQEPKVPKETSFMDRILRGGSGCLHAESLVSTFLGSRQLWEGAGAASASC